MRVWQKRAILGNIILIIWHICHKIIMGTVESMEEFTVEFYERRNGFG